MVKCAVSSCPNREQLSADRGFSRAPKRFFSLPQDPARIKVWLAALREPDTQAWAESGLICEDHFLPEDVSASGVSPDAIPIMPPGLEDELGLSAWTEEEEEEEEEGGWSAAARPDEEEEEEGETREEEEEQEEAVTEEMHTATETATAPPADRSPEAAPETREPSPPRPQRLLSPPRRAPVKPMRADYGLAHLTPQFLELLLNSDRVLDLHQAATALRSRRRRLYDITTVLKGLDLVQKEATRVRWTGKCPISSFLWSQQKMQKESEKLRLVEETLDGLIKSCAQQLFQMTDHPDNAQLAYVTLSDVQNLSVLEDQTVIVVKAPEETKLEVPAPKKDGIQIHLKSGSGPISVLACEVWPDGTKAEKGAFLQIQHSHIKTGPLPTESSSSHSAVPGL